MPVVICFSVSFYVWKGGWHLKKKNNYWKCYIILSKQPSLSSYQLLPYSAKWHRGWKSRMTLYLCQRLLFVYCTNRLTIHHVYWGAPRNPFKVRRLRRQENTQFGHCRLELSCRFTEIMIKRNGKKNFTEAGRCFVPKLCQQVTKPKYRKCRDHDTVKYITVHKIITYFNFRWRCMSKVL